MIYVMAYCVFYNLFSMFPFRWQRLIVLSVAGRHDLSYDRPPDTKIDRMISRRAL